MNYRIYLPNVSSLLLIICAMIFSFSTITRASVIGEASSERTPVADFDGDGKSDISVFRPSDGYWHILKSSGGNSSIQWGLRTDVPVPGDYDGDGKTDVAVYRRGIFPYPVGGFELSKSNWYILRSSDSTFFTKQSGDSSLFGIDMPAPADYDGDGRTNIAVYRVEDAGPGVKTFRVLQNSADTAMTIQWGFSIDRAAVADYDGDGKADFAVYRDKTSPGSNEAGIWYILQSSNNAIRVERFGLPSDLLVPSDYDGDGKADIAVWRPSSGLWCLLLSRDNTQRYIRFGLSEDKPTPGDYDGDGRTDIAVFRPSNGIWYLQLSSGGFRAEPFGLSTDIPIQNVFVR